MSPFKRIALVGKYQSREVAEAVLELARSLAEHGFDTMIEVNTAEILELPCGMATADFAGIGAGADIAVVLGGDGTLLGAARELAPYGVPLVGVNQGRLGFLTDISREHALEDLLQILAGDYVREERMLLEASVLRAARKVFRTVAFNDIVVSRGDMGQMIEFDLRVNGEFVYMQRSDGMILSTPTGSTAYALSANGPILHPSVAGIALVPICPHTLTARPITVADTAQIEIRLLPPHDVRVHFDGLSLFDVQAGDILHVTRSADNICLLHPQGHSYFAMLREKLHWSSNPRT